MRAENPVFRYSVPAWRPLRIQCREQGVIEVERHFLVSVVSEFQLVIRRVDRIGERGANVEKLRSVRMREHVHADLE